MFILPTLLLSKNTPNLSITSTTGRLTSGHHFAPLVITTAPALGINDGWRDRLEAVGNFYPEKTHEVRSVLGCDPVPERAVWSPWCRGVSYLGDSDLYLSSRTDSRVSVPVVCSHRRGPKESLGRAGWIRSPKTSVFG